MAIEITYYFKSNDPESKIVGEFGVKIPEWDLYFSKMKLIKTLNGGLFIGAPSYKHKDKEGKEEYKDYWFFGKEKGARFKEAVLKAVQEYIEKKFGNKPATEIPYDESMF